MREISRVFSWLWAPLMYIPRRCQCMPFVTVQRGFYAKVCNCWKRCRWCWKVNIICSLGLNSRFTFSIFCIFLKPARRMFHLINWSKSEWNIRHHCLFTSVLWDKMLCCILLICPKFFGIADLQTRDTGLKRAAFLRARRETHIGALLLDLQTNRLSSLMCIILLFATDTPISVLPSAPWQLTLQRAGYLLLTSHGQEYSKFFTK